jgi:hypothetical protein
MRQFIPSDVAAVTRFVLIPLVVIACGGMPTAPTTPTSAAMPSAVSAQSSMFAFRGDPQDWVSRGQSDVLTLQNALFRTTLNTGGVRVIVYMQRTDRPLTDVSSDWMLIIAGVAGRRISAGSFETTRSATATTAGLDISGNGSGCNQNTGHIDIHNVVFSPDLAILKELRASFEIHCEGAAPGIRGEVVLLADPWR